MRTSRLDLSLKLGRSRLEKESNIIEMIKTRRYLNASMKLLLSRRQRDRMKERTRYLLLNPEKSETEEQSDSDFNTVELQTDPEE